ncbi:MAG TPA: hypothetical protein VMA72_16105 [Streptosporangiaceae bacterium]|nr:hypothetical protein [Streptosporangiaceae bacterium]
MPPLRGLTEPERKLCESFEKGELADVQSGDAATDKTNNAALWAASRQVRAEVVSAILLGELTAVKRPRLRARGFRVTGCLDLSNAQIAVPLHFESCLFDSGIALLESRTRSVLFVGCEMPYLDVSNTYVDGQLEVTGSLLNWLGLYQTDVTGHLELSGAQLRQPDGTAINADYLRVRAAMYWNDCTVVGAVRLPGASIGGSLILDGAQLLNEGSWALAADRLTVGGDLQCRDGFVAAGEIGLASAQIGGRLFLGGDAAPAHVGPGGPPPARGPGLITGMVDLRDATLGSLSDDPTQWPERIRFNGLRYSELEPRLPAHRRLEWIARDPAGYQPQPYEQLAACYRRLGEDENARRVLLAKQRARRGKLGPVGKVWGYIQDATVGYGYRPWLASLWLLALLAAGSAYFAVRPAAPAVAAHGQFSPFAFTLYMIIPIVGQNQSADWTLNGPQQAVLYVLTVGAWTLFTAFAAGLTRSVSRG